MVGKALVVIKGQGFDERFWHTPQHLLHSRFGVICLAARHLFYHLGDCQWEPAQERGGG